MAAGNVVYVKLENFSQDSCGGEGNARGGSCRAVSYISVMVDPSVARQGIKSLHLSQG